MEAAQWNTAIIHFYLCISHYEMSNCLERPQHQQQHHCVTFIFDKTECAMSLLKKKKKNTNGVMGPDLDK